MECVNLTLGRVKNRKIAKVFFPGNFHPILTHKRVVALPNDFQGAENVTETSLPRYIRSIIPNKWLAYNEFE